ncbi:MAG TPA: hypothetical protein VH878_00380 [Thermodesulfobacteriota bacterium]
MYRNKSVPSSTDIVTIGDSYVYGRRGWKMLPPSAGCAVFLLRW